MKDFVEGYVGELVYARVGQKAILIDEKGKILMLRRSLKCSRPRGWDFAGGALERGENPQEGILREIREETGLEVTDLQLIDVVSYTSEKDDFMVMIGYQARAVSTNVQLSWEHDHFQWMTKEEVKKLELPKAHRSFFEHLHK